MNAYTPLSKDNPKKAFGAVKPSVGLIPTAALIETAGVMELGATKYGPFNWREDAVEAQTYYHAALRHLLSWWDGEDNDPESAKSHLAHAMSCMAILIDAKAVGKLKDNRPPKGAASKLIAKATKQAPKPVEATPYKPHPMAVIIFNRFLRLYPTATATREFVLAQAAYDNGFSLSHREARACFASLPENVTWPSDQYTAVIQTALSKWLAGYRG